MKRENFFSIILLFGGLLLLGAACTAAASMDVPVNVAAVVPDTVVIQDSSEASPDPAGMGETPTAIAPEDIPVDDCLACHMDQQLLMDTADPEVEVVSESEGEG